MQDGYTPSTRARLTFADYRLMRDHAGYSWRPGVETPEQGQVRSALALARAFSDFRADPDALVEWEHDPHPWDGDVPYDGPLYAAVLYHGDHVVGALCSVAVPDTSAPYCRVIEAELYDDFAHEREARREACIVRGEN